MSYTVKRGASRGAQARRRHDQRKLPCGHLEYQDGHCADMACSRYVSKCPLHATAQTGEECNLAGRIKVRVTGRRPADECYPAVRGHMWDGNAFAALAVEIDHQGRLTAADPYTGRRLQLLDAAPFSYDLLRRLIDAMEQESFLGPHGAGESGEEQP